MDRLISKCVKTLLKILIYIPNMKMWKDIFQIQLLIACSKQHFCTDKIVINVERDILNGEKAVNTFILMQGSH